VISTHFKKVGAIHELPLPFLKLWLGFVRNSLVQINFEKDCKAIFFKIYLGFEKMQSAVLHTIPQ